jgi:hypothetical protein
MTEFLQDNRITKDQSRDTGMAMVLLLLILFMVTKRQEFVIGAAAVHILNMTLPRAYQPVARLWLALSRTLGTIVSTILLCIVFFVVVTPVGLLRRLLGEDSLALRGFKTGDDSVMVVRNHTFTGRDIERPY